MGLKVPFLCTGLMLVLPLGYAVFAQESGETAACKAEYESIDQALKAANYCEHDEDCKVLPLGGIYIQFGCYHFINAKEDDKKLYQRIEAYHQRCARMIDDCDAAPRPVCSSGKCVAPDREEK